MIHDVQQLNYVWLSSLSWAARVNVATKGGRYQVKNSTFKIHIWCGGKGRGGFGQFGTRKSVSSVNWRQQRISSLRDFNSERTSFSKIILDELPEHGSESWFCWRGKVGWIHSTEYAMFFIKTKSSHGIKCIKMLILHSISKCVLITSLIKINLIQRFACKSYAKNTHMFQNIFKTEKKVPKSWIFFKH